MESLTTLVSNWSVRIGDWANQGFRKVLLATTVCFALIIGTLQNAMGQEFQDTIQYRWNIRTTFGNTYIGTIEQLENGAIRCQTENVGAITIQARNIRSMSVIDPSRFKDGKYYPENPLASKYFFGGSAYTVEKDQGIYRNTWVFINQFDFGITDNFSLGGGIIPFFLIAGGPTPVWLNSKVRFPVQEDKINLALNGLVGGVLGDFGTGPLSLLTGVVTFGPPEQNITIGGGLGTSLEEATSSAVLQLGGMGRIGKNTYFITENYFFTLDGVFLTSLGGRTIWRGIALDFGGIGTLDSFGFFLASPWLSVTLPIGRSFDIR